MLTVPEPFVLTEGDCLVYPTSTGRVRNPYVSPRKEDWFYGLYPWTHDGWAAAIVLACRHRFETFARYLIALFRYDDPTRPEPDQFGDLSILRSGTFMPNPLRRVHLVSTTRQHLERMRVEVIANLPVNTNRVAEEFEDEPEMPGREFANDAWTLPDLHEHRPTSSARPTWMTRSGSSWSARARCRARRATRSVPRPRDRRETRPRGSTRPPRSRR
jgi:hypothetical protein